MSNYRTPGQFGDDAELERQLQEEYRRRAQVLQQGGMTQQQQMAGMSMPPQQQVAGVSRGMPRQPDAYSYAGSTAFAYPAGGGGQQGGMQQQQRPQQQQSYQSYSQVTNPYSGLADARAAYARGAALGGGAETPSAAAQQMYAPQQPQQQRRSYPPQQQMYPYSAQQQPRGSGSGLDYYGGMPPYRDYAPAPTAHSLAQQAAEATDPYAALRSKPKHTKRSKSPAEHEAGDSGGEDEAGKPKKAMLQKVTSTIHKTKSTARIVVKDGATVIEDGENQWFTGCVPLGLEDDKYWLSELQVYLRANFAEAFGATEEDIAAPMHGRNKPIALGQVGIRCMHCKSK